MIYSAKGDGNRRKRKVRGRKCSTFAVAFAIGMAGVELSLRQEGGEMGDVCKRYARRSHKYMDTFASL